MKGLNPYYLSRLADMRRLVDTAMSQTDHRSEIFVDCVQRMAGFLQEIQEGAAWQNLGEVMQASEE